KYVVCSLLGIGIVSEVRDQFVVPVEDGDTPCKVGNHKIISTLMHVAGTTQFLRTAAELFSVQAQKLQAVVFTISHGQNGRGPTRIEPDSMRSSHLPGLGPFASPRADIPPFAIVLMNPTQSVSVADIDVARGPDGDARGSVFVRILVNAGFFRVAQGHQHVAIQRRLDDFMTPVGGKTPVFCGAFFDNSHAVRPALKVFPPGFYEFSVRVEDNHGMLRIGVDKNTPLGVRDDAAMSVAVLHPIRQFSPTPYPLILVRSAAQNDLAFLRSGRKEQPRRKSERRSFPDLCHESSTRDTVRVITSYLQHGTPFVHATWKPLLVEPPQCILCALKRKRIHFDRAARFFGILDFASWR